MSGFEEPNFVSENIESSLKTDFNTSPNITSTGSSEPIKILLFPPQNKQFRFDKDKETIEIEPIEPETPSLPDKQDVAFHQSTPVPGQETTLTPLIEKCNIFKDCDLTNVPISEQSTPVKVLKYNQTVDQVNVKEILKIENVFARTKLKKDCFLKGCKWSADGLCLLSNSEDKVLRIFEISENLLKNPVDNIEPALEMKEGGTVYDFAWYPRMSSLDPVSCVFACTSQDSPIHLWDAYTGQLRATYQPINQYDEVTSAYSLAFTPDGWKIYSGFKKCLRIFDISLPGRVSEERKLKTKETPIFQSNIISCICINPSIPSLYALGSYDKTLGIYADPGDLICILKGHTGGLTQITFSSDGNYLYSGGRKDPEILCWDIRNPGKIVFSIERKVSTQQKIQFDLSPDEGYLITGNTDCNIKMYTSKGGELVKNFKGHEDCVNGVQFHPTVPIFASTSGQRHFPSISCDNEDEEETNGNREERLNIENSIKLWSFKRESEK